MGVNPRSNARGPRRTKPVVPTQYVLTDKGRPRALAVNVRVALDTEPALRGVVRWDEFALRVCVGNPPPWDPDRRRGDEWTDVDDSRLAGYLASRCDVYVSSAIAHEGVNDAAHAAGYHPVRDYLAGLRWDGQPRLERLMPDYFGTPNTEYTQMVGRLGCIAAVARIQRPGVKVDTMINIEGAQGARKSSGLRELFGSDWFTDDLSDVGTKDAAMQLVGRWCVELSELDAIGRREAEAVKAFLSRQVDRIRPPYGRRVIELPRQCIFIGSTNQDTYLKDPTGARRFWPVRAGAVDVDALGRDRNQLWAEARVAFEDGAQWWPDPVSADQIAEEAEQRFQVDVWESVVSEWLDRNGSRRNTMTTAGLLKDALGIDVANQSRQAEMRVGAIMRRLGYRQVREQAGGVRRRRWTQGEA